MYVVEVRNFSEWRAAARPLLAARISPAEVVWGDARTPLVFTDSKTEPAPEIEADAPLTISRQLLKLLEELAHFRDTGRWELMYRLAWRSLSNRALLEDPADPDVSRALEMSRAIHRDIHKMHAFVRFREAETEDGEKRYVAWFEPGHEILRAAAPFFRKRFPNMKWMIATPDGAAVWDGREMNYIDVPDRSTLPRADTHETLWRTYYRNICNVARINTAAMQREMPQRYWRHLPESSEIPKLLHEGTAGLERAHSQLMETQQANGAGHDDAQNGQPPSEFVEVQGEHGWQPIHAPEAVNQPAAVANAASLPGMRARKGRPYSPGGHEPLPRAMADALARIAQPADTPMACRRCDLWKRATQAVLGEGAANAAIMLVGEQPGDEEDLRGRPFVGPAGRLLDQALQTAEIARDELFITNAVKHFKWEPRGKRRLHKRPDAREIAACGVWLDEEILRVSPRVIVALGATAQRSLSGGTQPIESARREVFQHPSGALLFVTYHPSAILRADGERAEQLRAALIHDLRRAQAAAAQLTPPNRDQNAGLYV